VNIASLVSVVASIGVIIGGLSPLLQRWDRAARIKKTANLAESVPAGPGKDALIAARDLLAIRHSVSMLYLPPGLFSTLRTACLTCGFLVLALLTFNDVAASPQAPAWLPPVEKDTVPAAFQQIATVLLMIGSVVHGGLIGDRRTWVREQIRVRTGRPAPTGWRAFFQ